MSKRHKNSIFNNSTVITEPIVMRILEIRFDTDYGFYDNRGRLFKEITNIFEFNKLEQYSISVNQNFLSNADGTLQVFFGDKNCGINSESNLKSDNFLNDAEKFISYFENKSKLYNSDKLVRIGIKSLYSFYSAQSMSTLIGLVRSKYANISHEAEEIYTNKGIGITDIGIPLDMESDDYFVHSLVGAMDKNQFLQYMQPKNKAIANNLPKQGICTDFDFSIRKNKLSDKNITEFTKLAVNTSDDLAIKIKGLILN